MYHQHDCTCQWLELLWLEVKGCGPTGQRCAVRMMYCTTPHNDTLHSSRYWGSIRNQLQQNLLVLARDRAISPSWHGKLMSRKGACLLAGYDMPFAALLLGLCERQCMSGQTLRFAGPGHNSFFAGLLFGSSLSDSRCRLAKRCRFGDHDGIYMLIRQRCKSQG